ncbi:uncharacterized protein LOC134440288 isoform X3 [Engraulis encrasicolus]|uniref:uncharacterized protein LOC134440288 isoform X3 n=1 Tax=Engraulis encrasicolus TaxID=184585 RepID=UPI002FD0C5CC
MWKLGRRSRSCVVFNSSVCFCPWNCHSAGTEYLTAVPLRTRASSSSCTREVYMGIPNAARLNGGGRGGGCEAGLKGKLLQAAEKNDDHTILLHIKDEDCVALGVQYHRSCYREYTRKKTTKVEEPTFDVSYKMFCERIIRQRLINNQEVMKMEQLQKIFTVMATSIEGLDASDYSEVKLKSRLRRDFHQLVFQTLKRCPSQLVFAESPTETETPMDTTQPSPAAEQPSQSGETTPSNSATEEKTVDLHTTPEETRTLYTAALLLKTLLSDAPPPQDVSVNEGLTVVPLELFNLVSWVIGASEEPTLEHTVNIPDDLHLKVLSVCQDIAYLASRDQKQSVCPWHLEDENLHVTLRTKPS